MIYHWQPISVLVVDDEPIMRAAVAESLQQLGDNYSIDLASSGGEALSKMQSSNYSLLLTDSDIHDMNGLRLARLVRRLSPETRIVLMADARNAGMRQSALRDGLDGFLDKPFTVNQIRTAVKRALPPEPDSVEPYAVSLPGAPLRDTASERAAAQDVEEHAAPGVEATEVLEGLLRVTRARCVLLVRSDGFPVAAVGQTSDLHLPSLAALVAAAFAATAELSRQLGNESLFKASHHDGPDCSLYSCEVNDNLLLSVIFGEESLPGAVWLFAKQAAAKLAGQLSHAEPPLAIDEGLASAIDSELDDLFSTET